MKVIKHINQKIFSTSGCNFGGQDNYLFIGRKVKTINGELVQFEGDWNLWFNLCDFEFDEPTPIIHYEIY